MIFAMSSVLRDNWREELKNCPFDFSGVDFDSIENFAKQLEAEENSPQSLPLDEHSVPVSDTVCADDLQLSDVQINLRDRHASYLSEPLSPLLAMEEFVKSSRKFLLSTTTPSSDAVIVKVVSGVFVKGSRTLLNQFRLFYCLNLNRLIKTSAFNSSRHTDIIVTDQHRVCPEFEFAKLPSPVEPRTTITVTQSGPGCGKSFTLVRMAQALGPRRVLVLSSTRMGKNSLSKQLPDFTVLTVDAYLMNGILESEYLLIDEFSLVHPGKLLYCVAISNCSVAHAFGDVCQISFIPRFDGYKFLFSNPLAFFPVVDQLNVSYRSPPDVCSAISEVYVANGLQPLTSRSPVRSTSVSVKSLRCLDTTSFDKVMVFTQAEKKQFSNCNTVHELQGQEFDRIALVIGGFTSLLESTPHVIVALSRHRKHLKIFCDDFDDNLLFFRLVRNILMFDFTRLPIIGGGLVTTAPATFDVWMMSQPKEFMSLPRSNKLVLPDSWKKTKTCCLVTSAIEKPISIKFGDHAVVTFADFFTPSYRDLHGVFEPISYLLKSRNVMFSSNLFKGKIQSHLIGRVLNKLGVKNLLVHTVDTDVISNEVFKIAVVNDLDLTPEDVPLFHEENVVKLADVHPTDVTDPTIALDTIQDFVCAFMSPETTFTNTEFDEFMVHHNDIAIPLDEVSFRETEGAYSQKQFDKLRPSLFSPAPRPQQNTNINSMLSVVKRNANVPKLSTLIDTIKEADLLVDKLFSLCPGIPVSFCLPSADDVQNWINIQPSTVQGILGAFDEAADHQLLNFYDFSLKSSPKPDLTVNASSSYPAVQTILCQNKSINAVFCPLLQIVRDRILTHLDPRIMFFTKVDDDTFARHLTDRFPPHVAKLYNCLEFDMSKYDKSQGELVLEFECRLFERIGVPPRFVDMWRFAHVHCTARNASTKLQFNTWFQRKSGDASTYFGNTLILMMSILDVVPIKDVGMLLVSGDDSLLWTTRKPESIKFSVLSTKYNFEVKLFMFRYHYFCSKFVLEHDDNWFMIPDPLKRAVKLGRHDLANFDHVEEYRISFLDNVKHYSNLSLADILTRALCDRYNCSFDCNPAISAMHQMAVDKELFKTLFYTLPSDTLCLDPTRGKLEL
nr:putative helicase-RdRP protein [Tomato fruit blotch virus]